MKSPSEKKKSFLLGENSDVLIHEATMDDSLEAVASSKLHSTSSQAIQIGKEMNARFILLTHFSQRYSHIPLFNENFTEEVGVAFDNMMVIIVFIKQKIIHLHLYINFQLS